MRQFGFWSGDPQQKLDSILYALENADSVQEAAEKVYRSAMMGINTTGHAPCEIPSLLRMAFVKTYPIKSIPLTTE